jgi:hypothetical protein
VEDEFVEARRQRCGGCGNFGGIHAEQAVKAPDRIRVPAQDSPLPGLSSKSGHRLRRRGDPTAGSIEREPPKGISPEPSRRVGGSGQDTRQFPNHPGVQVEVVMAVEESAGETGMLEQLPLAPDLLLDQFPMPGQEPQKKPGPHRRGSPRPAGASRGMGVAQVQMPADFESRIGPGEFDGVMGRGLTEHQAGPGEGTLAVGNENGFVDFRAQTEVIGNEGHSFHDFRTRPTLEIGTAVDEFCFAEGPR